MNRLTPILVVMAGCSLLSPAQTTRLVPSQYPTIQAAIGACVNGDTVVVAPGTHAGGISFVGKAITVTSSGGAAATTIAGTSGNPVVNFMTNEGHASVLSGFTVTGGAGILIQNTSPTILNCRIVNNTKSGTGAGISCTSTGTGATSPVITGCTIANNISTANGPNGGIGAGGLSFDSTSSVLSLPAVTNCAIESNLSLTGIGAGVAISGRVQASFSSCVINDNTTSDLGAGVGLTSLGYGSAIFTSCVLSGNHTPLRGGGLYAQNMNVTLTGCLIRDNFSGDRGGAVYFAHSAGLPVVTLNVQSGTVVGNTTNSVVGGISNQDFGSPIINITNTICWGNSGLDLYAPGIGVTYSDIGFGLFVASAGMLSTDPLLAGASDYHLSSISPCRNAGWNGAPGMTSTDLDGTPRIQGGTVDIGADEAPVLTQPGTPDGLDLYAWVNGRGDPLATTRPAAVGAQLSIKLATANPLLLGAVPVMVVELFANGSPPVATPPFIWVDGAALVFYGSLLPSPPFTVPGLPAGGLGFTFTVPPGLSGQTVRFQGAVTSVNTWSGGAAVSNATDVTF